MSHYDLAITLVCGGFYIASIAALHSAHVVCAAECTADDCRTCRNASRAARGAP